MGKNLKFVPVGLCYVACLLRSCSKRKTTALPKLICVIYVYVNVRPFNVPDAVFRLVLFLVAG